MGQADATLVMCDGKNMLIDAGNVEDSDLMYTYLKNLGVEYLDYVIATHPHEDHIGGMAGALSYAKAGTVYCPTDNYNNEIFESFKKYVELSHAQIQIPTAGESFSLGAAEITILGCNFAEGENNASIVLKITYGKTSFLFMADAEREAEQALLDSGYDLSATVLKVGHHGSNTSTSYPFLREISPDYAVISCGKGNDYGHPHDEVLSRLRDAETTVYRTDLQGDIICTSNGKKVTFTTSKGKQLSSYNGNYVLNTNTFKYHTVDCINANSMAKKNRKEYSGDLNSLISKGYSPARCCG